MKTKTLIVLLALILLSVEASEAQCWHLWKSDNQKLYDAVKAQNVDCIKETLDEGADPLFIPDGSSSSFTLATSVQVKPDILKILVDHVNDVDALDGYEYSALRHAVENSDLTKVRILVNAGANVNLRNDEDQMGLTPLQSVAGCHTADWSKCLEVAKYLVDHGASVDAQWRGETALDQARKRRDKLSNPDSYPSEMFEILDPVKARQRARRQAEERRQVEEMNAWKYWRVGTKLCYSGVTKGGLLSSGRKVRIVAFLEGRSDLKLKLRIADPDGIEKLDDVNIYNGAVLWIYHGGWEVC